MSAASVLSALFECAPGARFELDHLREILGDELAPLQRSGLLIEVEPARHVICTDCDEVHAVPVESRDGKFVSFCAIGGGCAEVGPEALRRFVFDHSGLVDALGNVFGLPSPPTVLVRNICWRLGVPAISGVSVAALVAREMDDPRRLAEAASAIQGRITGGPAFILCDAHPPIERGFFPDGFRVADMSDLVALTEHGAVTLDISALEMLLGKGKRRTPKHHAKLRPHIDNRLRAGEALEGDSAEARFLLDNSDGWASSKAALPEFDAVRMAISRRRKLLG